MIGIKSQVNKDYTILFGIQSRRGKVPDGQNPNSKSSHISMMSFFKQENVTLNGPHESSFFYSN